MKRTILTLTLIVSAIITVNAQAPDGVQFGVGIRLGFPSGRFADSHSFGVGIEGQVEYGLVEKVSLVGTTGYTTFFGKDFTILGITVKNDAVGYIPILAGIRFYPVNQLFIGAQAGYGILSGSGNSDGAFNYQTQVGFNGEKVQIAASYNAFSKDNTILSHIGLTGIYKFGNGGKK